MSSYSRQLFALLVAVLLIAPGCSLFKGSLNPQNLNEANSNSSVALLYRTESDRLNLAAGSATIQQVSHEQNRTSLLPPVSTSTLKVAYPHPGGRPDHAQVFVAFSPTNGESATGSMSFLTKLTSFGSSAPDEAAEPFEVWALDVPKYQLDGIVAKLQKENFFRRSKVLGSSTYLGVSLDGKGFGKNYRNVEELDALIVRVCQQGWQVGPDGKPLHIRRPVPPRHEQGVYQARAKGPWNGNVAPGFHQRAPEYQPQPQQRPSEYQQGYGQPAYGLPQSEQPRYEQPQYARPPYEQPQYARPPYEQPQYEQAGNFQPNYYQARLDRPHYEQPANNQPLYEQPRYDAQPMPGPSSDYRQPAAQTNMR